MGLPWIGFAFGCTLARLTKRPPEDVIAIAIETGVQNTGMSIFILWFTLDQPLGDMTGTLKKVFPKLLQCLCNLCRYLYLLTILLIMFQLWFLWRLQL